MKDSDLGIPPRPTVVPNGANGPTPQPTEERRRGPPTKEERAAREANITPLSTAMLIETKRELETLVKAAGQDQELLDGVAVAQLAVSDLERILITRRKGSQNAR